MADNSIEITIKADGRQALANLERLRQAFGDVDAKASTSRMRTELETLGRTAQRVLGRELTSAFSAAGVGAGLFAGGIVAGLAATAKGLVDMARSGLQLHDLSRELNVSAEA